MTVATAFRPAAWHLGMPLPGLLRLVGRELRSGLGGFYVFLACLALGVAVIASVGTLSKGLKLGFQRQGEAILGGDITFARMHARATERERDWFATQGRVSETASMRALARRLDGDEDQALVELKAIDAAYPMAGEIELNPGATLDSAVREGMGAAVDPVLLERLGLKIGDRVKIGDAELEIRAQVLAEPDAIADRLTYGPRVLVSLDTLDKTGMIKPGTLVRWRYAIQLPGGAGRSEQRLVDLREAAKSALPEAGFTVTDRRDPNPQVSKTLERLRQFLTLLGLTALLTGGVGVANAVATFIDRRRKVIATMRSLGASSRIVFSLFLLQVMAVAAVGIAIGLCLGSLVPPMLARLFGDALPIKAELAVSWTSLLTAAAYGFLVALLFALWPLARAREISAAALFRDEVAETSGRPHGAVLWAMAGLALVLVASAVFSAESRLVASYFCAGIVLSFALFLGLGQLVTVLARRIRRPRRPELSLAIGNIGAPGGLTRSVVLSLGSGLTLLVAVALANASLVDELTSRIPEQSPSYFVLDIPPSDYPAFAELVVREVPGATLVEAPMLRGRLVRLKDENVESIKAPPEAQWVLNGDRGLTYAESVPEGSKVVKGDWWPADYAGEPLVSFETELAEKLGVGIGDTVTVNVLGRNLTARIANLREVKWESLSLNFVMVFSPNALRDAPHNLLSTITLPKDTTLAAETKLARSLGKTFPSVSAIRVKDAIDAFNRIFAKVMTAVEVGGSVTLLAGALVLAGALATAQRRRILEAVILKALGATRRRILTAHFVEYGLLAMVTALLAVGLGALVAWVAVREVMEIEFSFSWKAVVEALALAMGLVALFGGVGTWLVLRAPAVPYLRSE